LSKEVQMKKALVIGIALVFGFAIFMVGTPTTAQAKTTFVTIGTGGITGVYYPTGGAIAKMVNVKSMASAPRSSQPADRCLTSMPLCPAIWTSVLSSQIASFRL